MADDNGKMAFLTLACLSITTRQHATRFLAMNFRRYRNAE